MSSKSDPIKWIGTAAGIAGAVLLALNIPSSGWGFVLFLVSSTAWVWAAWRTGDLPLLLLNLAFTAANILGIWRWLIL